MCRCRAKSNLAVPDADMEAEETMAGRSMYSYYTNLLKTKYSDQIIFSFSYL
jgi:hypothetical protein